MWKPGPWKASAKLYPSPLAGMERRSTLCSASPADALNRPAPRPILWVMAQQYFLSHQGVSPEKIRKAAGLLEQGYEKLTGFESENNGYEWFGGDPGHEALTAYGLMQFHEMKEVMPVDRSMLERTEKWLLSRRDGNGGFLRNERALDSFLGGLRLRQPMLISFGRFLSPAPLLWSCRVKSGM